MQMSNIGFALVAKYLLCRGYELTEESGGITVCTNGAPIARVYVFDKIAAFPLFPDTLPFNVPQSDPAALQQLGETLASWYCQWQQKVRL